MSDDVIQQCQKTYQRTEGTTSVILIALTLQISSTTTTLNNNNNNNNHFKQDKP